jgi:hypothetical protein
MPAVDKWLTVGSGETRRLKVTSGKYAVEWFKLSDINRQESKLKSPYVDRTHNSALHLARTEVIERLNANQCEYCVSIIKCESMTLRR